MVVDNTEKICHIQSGFLGHQNDAQHFRLMPQIVHNQELDFRNSVRRKCRKLNRLITEYRVKVEYAICDLKHYKIIGTLWRHPRRKLNKIVELCGAFVRRRQTLFY